MKIPISSLDGNSLQKCQETSMRKGVQKEKYIAILFFFLDDLQVYEKILL